MLSSRSLLKKSFTENSEAISWTIPWEEWRGCGNSNAVWPNPSLWAEAEDSPFEASLKLLLRLGGCPIALLLLLLLFISCSNCWNICCCNELPCCGTWLLKRPLTGKFCKLPGKLLDGFGDIEDEGWQEMLKGEDPSNCIELWMEFIELCLISRFW